MEKYFIEKDIAVFCVPASSFPEGVMKAHEFLHAHFTPGDNRKIFGISYPDNAGNIIYKAAAEQLYDGESEKILLENFTIKAGGFISEFIPDFCKDISQVGQTFQALLKQPDIDPHGYCLEMYEGEDGKDVRCMVPLKY